MADINDIAERQKAALLTNERRASVELVRAYGLAYSRISERVAKLTAQIDDARSKGEIISSSFLYERDRLKNLQIEIERELRRFAADAAGQVTTAQSTAIETANRDARQLVTVSVGEASSALSFAGLDREALAALAGRAGDGSPLRLLFDKIAPQMSARIGDELVAGVAEGAPARVIASRIRERSGMGLARALLIARQETLRAYRTATLENYEAAGVVNKWRWLASRNAGTCAVCWAMDGKEFSLKVKHNSHVGCRCTMIPVTDLTPPAQEGTEAFNDLEPGVQRQILGDAKYKAFKSGELNLNNLVGVSQSPEWGTARFERSLKDALDQRQE